MKDLGDARLLVLPSPTLDADLFSRGPETRGGAPADPARGEAPPGSQPAASVWPRVLSPPLVGPPVLPDEGTTLLASFKL